MITEVLNSVFRYEKVPEMFIMGYITPIYKKKKKKKQGKTPPPHAPNNLMIQLL